MNAISTFTFHQDHNVRVQLINGEPYFCLRDICTVLSVDARSSSKFGLDVKGMEKLSTPSKGGDQNLNYVNEPNLYRVIFRSNKPEARQFQDWVFNEVLPTIRKTGQYQVPKPITEKREYLNGADIQNIKRLVWSCSSFLDKENAFSNAVWHSLRKVTSVPSPANFEVSHLPILATEFKRIFSIIEPYINARQQCEKILIKRLLREREDAQLLNELLATMNMSASQVMHLKAKESLDKVFNQDCLHLIQRTA